MTARKMDRWWMIIVAFLVAAGMVLLVLLAMGVGPTDDGGAPARPAGPGGHHARSRVFVVSSEDRAFIAA